LETDSDVHKAYRSDNYRLLTSIIGTLPEGEENQLRCDGAFPEKTLASGFYSFVGTL